MAWPEVKTTQGRKEVTSQAHDEDAQDVPVNVTVVTALDKTSMEEMT